VHNQHLTIDTYLDIEFFRLEIARRPGRIGNPTWHENKIFWALFPKHFQHMSYNIIRARKRPDVITFLGDCPGTPLWLPIFIPHGEENPFLDKMEKAYKHAQEALKIEESRFVITKLEDCAFLGTEALRDLIRQPESGQLIPLSDPFTFIRLAEQFFVLLSALRFSTLILPERLMIGTIVSSEELFRRFTEPEILQAEVQMTKIEEHVYIIFSILKDILSDQQCLKNNLKDKILFQRVFILLLVIGLNNRPKILKETQQFIHDNKEKWKRVLFSETIAFLHELKSNETSNEFVQNETSNETFEFVQNETSNEFVQNDTSNETSTEFVQNETSNEFVQNDTSNETSTEFVQNETSNDTSTEFVQNETSNEYSTEFFQNINSFFDKLKNPLITLEFDSYLIFPNVISFDMAVEQIYSESENEKKHPPQRNTSKH